ncbi:unnamed protein product, partial [Brassica oleracea var. botrytis]
MFTGLLNSGEKTQSVMVVTTVNPKIFGGNLYLNSTPVTKFYFDTNIPPSIKELKSSLGGAAAEVFPCVDTMEAMKKVKMSIGDLNT